MESESNKFVYGKNVTFNEKSILDRNNVTNIIDLEADNIEAGCFDDNNENNISDDESFSDANDSSFTHGIDKGDK